ncbi:DUF3800 domain-containing protein [Brytella acorum]|uniref:DUF3800 domain-containing protein n=1 Tax=Brytella acorum TaxID=2959299 RepID=UPI0025ADB848|nr:DUF3800 domain-containing protein [Brytella acorum]MDF3626153.1 DUF3800 domain-containing protein [Brytella acorum]
MTDEIASIPIDVNQMREPAILLYNLKDADDHHTFYYDESNNLRRLHITEDGLNVPDPMVYVLGGVAHHGQPKNFAFDALCSAIHLQKTVKELKFEHVAKGNFLQVLTSRKLSKFLDWVLQSDLFIHYIAMDPLYWSTVDIIDSSIDDNPHLMMVARQLKNDLYTVLRKDFSWLVDAFIRYGYPNLGPSGPTFIAELLAFIEDRNDVFDSFSLQMLKGVLEKGARAKELPFLQDETANVLIDSFLPFVIHRLCLFKNSTHVLDVEPFIEKRLKKNRFMDEEREVSMYRYAISHNEPGVQISDVVVGLLAKFFSWIARTSIDDVLEARGSLTEVQEHNRQLIAKLFERSTTSTDAYVQRIICLEDETRGALFLN